MDAGSSSSRKSKRKFAPRAPPRPRRPTAAPTTTDADGEERTAQMIASNYAIGRVKPKAEEKASPEVAFQRSSTTLPIVPVSVSKDDGKRSDLDLEPSLSGDVLAVVSSATDLEDGVETVETLTLDDGDASVVPEPEKHYVEPWDHRNPYSPITLPLRKPPSGDPELRDKEEFGEVARYPDYDENTINSAEELGLTPNEHGEEKLLFFQLPGPLPVKKQSTDANNEDKLQRPNAFDGLQRGSIGKMRIYRSGAVKLKLGDILYDVSPGPNTDFFNTVAAINTREREFHDLGSYEKIATVTPDINALLNSEADMETKR